MAPVVTPWSGLRRSRNRDKLLANVRHKGKKSAVHMGEAMEKF